MLRQFLILICTTVLLSLTIVRAAASPMELAAYQADKQTLSEQPGMEYIPSSVLVKFKASALPNTVNRALASAKASHVRSFGLVPGLNHIRTQLSVEQAVTILSRNPLVEYAEPDYVQRAFKTPNDPYFSLQWGLNNTGQSIRGVIGNADADIDMPEAWDATTGGVGCLVAVIDTGAQWTHPDLDDNIWANPGEIAGNGVDDDGNGYVDDVRGWDFWSGDSNPDDGDGHGTHTAGTIAAEGDNAIGVAGVAWNCKIMPLRFLGPNGGTTADAIEALNYAVAKGVKVSNNSWGGGGFSSALYNAIMNARSHGHIFVAAAGNNGMDTDNSPSYPASYDLDNIISVAATDNQDQLASFSNYGANTVDLGAPGVDVASTYSGSNYVWMSGTSMAAPHVSGVVALVYLQNPGYSYAQVIDRILSTARPASSLSGITRTGAILNAQSALNNGSIANTAPTVSILSPADGATFTTETSITFNGSAVDQQDGDLSGALVWTSSLDGNIGIGASFSTSSLNAGTHSITATVTDAGGLPGSNAITIAVSSATASPPADPTNISATNNRNNTATVKWQDNSDNEDGFEIERQKKNKRGWGSSSLFSTGSNTTSYTDSSGSGTFRYRVRARNSAGISNWTAFAEVSVTRK